MKKNQSSSRTNPLRYFEYFLKKDSLELYVKSFFDNPINPSFKSNRKEGYIYYLRDSYSDDELPYVKLYFKQKLEKHLSIHFNASMSLIKERIDEIENTHKNANIYIERQLIKVDAIKKSIKYFEIYQLIIFEVLDKLKSNLLNLLEEESKPTISTKIKFYGKSFFDLKKEIKHSHLKKLYQVTSELDIIDDDITTEEEFIKVITLPNLPSKNFKIEFNKNNRIVVYYIKIISSLFNNLKPRTIQESKSFMNKNGKRFNENDINKVTNYFKDHDISKYEYIEKEILKILPK